MPAKKVLVHCLQDSLPLTLAYGCTAAAAKSLQSYPTLCDPIDSSPSGSAVPGILQGITLECAAISFSNAWKGKVKVKALSRVRVLATPWTEAYQAPPSMGFSRREYWHGLPLVVLDIHNFLWSFSCISYMRDLFCFLSVGFTFAFSVFLLKYIWHITQI